MLSVRTRQKYLKNLGYYKGQIDGIEGKQTKQAYLDLQKDYFPKKEQDGIYGQKTEILLRNAERVRLYTKNFELKEFKCPCNKYCTGYPALLNINLLKNTQSVRDKFGVTTIESGLRCQKYNDSLKGSIKGSKHTKGKAADYIVYKHSTLSKRKQIVDYFIGLKKSSYSYTNGYKRTKFTKGTVYAPNMQVSVHGDVI